MLESLRYQLGERVDLLASFARRELAAEEKIRLACHQLMSRFAPPPLVT